MLLIYIFCALFVLNFILIFAFCKIDEIGIARGIGFFQSIILATLGIMIYMAATSTVRWEEFKIRYSATKAIVETYHPYDYGNTADITKEMLEINSAIARNKARCHSKWFDVWYSEEVGNLEPLVF